MILETLVPALLWGEAEKIKYEDIVKALVKTIKFYEQADRKKEEQLEEEQTWREDADQTCDRMSRYIVKLVRENEQLKNEIEYQERKNDKLTDANLKQFSTIQERNNEIDALKHMLDRKDD